MKFIPYFEIDTEVDLRITLRRFTGCLWDVRRHRSRFSTSTDFASSATKVSNCFELTVVIRQWYASIPMIASNDARVIFLLPEVTRPLHVWKKQPAWEHQKYWQDYFLVHIINPNHPVLWNFPFSHNSSLTEIFSMSSAYFRWSLIFVNQMSPVFCLK